MPDVETPPAESSPAAPEPSTESKPSAEPGSIPTDPKGYAEWRKTGNLPSAESAPAKEKSAEAKAEEKSAPAPEAGKPQQEKKPRSNAESRLEEILSDLRTAGLSPSELKSFKREVRQEQAKAAPEPPAKPPAPAVKKLEDYDSIEAYLEDLADHKANQRLEAYRAEEQQKAQRKATDEKLADADKRYGEGAATRIVSTAKSIFNDNAIPAAVRAMADDSPVLVDLMYVMGSDPNELDEFVSLAKSNPGAAIRKLVLVEKLVQEELAKGGTPKASGNGDAPQRDESGKFLPAKKTTSAPPPPRETSGRSSPPPDESETALRDGDFARFREVENRRDIARRKGL
jgi:hypothetical protein